MSSAFPSDHTLQDTTDASPLFEPALPLDRIDRSQNVRADLGDLTEMTASVAADGVKQPVSVYRNDDRYILWMGYRRFEACVQAGKTTIPALICPKPSPGDYLAGQMAENLVRTGMDDRDTHRGVVKLEAMGLPRKAIAERFGKSPASITLYFSPAERGAKVQEAFFAGLISCGDCYAMRDLKKDSDFELAALDLRLKPGSKQADLKRTVKKPKADAVRTSSIKCPLPDGSLVKITGNDLSLEEAMEVLSEATKAMKKAIGLKYTAKTFSQAMKDMAAN